MVVADAPPRIRVEHCKALRHGMLRHRRGLECRTWRRTGELRLPEWLERLAPVQPELDMMLSTSDVAVCCSCDSVRSSVRCRSSLSSRAFSMAITA